MQIELYSQFTELNKQSFEVRLCAVAIHVKST